MKRIVPYLLLLILAVAAVNAGVCPLSSSQLKTVRLQAAQNWIYRITGDIPTYYARCAQYLLENSTSMVDYVIKCPNAIVITEYGLLVLITDLRLFPGPIFPESENWIDDDTVTYKFGYGIQVNTAGKNLSIYEDFGFTVLGDLIRILNETQFGYMRFAHDETENCVNVKIQDEFVAENELTKRFFTANGFAGTALGVPTLCGMIQTACPAGTEYEQYATMEECIEYLSTEVAPDGYGLCPFTYSSKSMSCYLLHGVSAGLGFIDPMAPSVHCPHVGRQSDMCIDRCLESCDLCRDDDADVIYPIADPTLNAQCIVKQYINFTIPDYQCACKSGYVRDTSVTDKFKCVPVQCSQDYQCYFNNEQKKNWGAGSCINGLCVPRNGFSWNSDPQNPGFYCQYGQQQVFHTAGSQITCRQPGFCNPNVTESQARVECQTISDYTKVKCVDVSGGDINIITHRPNVCLCNLGFSGGREFPCTCNGHTVWSNLINGEVCLQQGQCMNPYDCQHGYSCVGASSTSIGNCIKYTFKAT